MNKEENGLSINRCITVFLYTVLTSIGFSIFREQQFNILILALVISLLPGAVIPLKKNVIFIGICIFLSFLLFLLLSYLNNDYQSLLAFSLVLFDYLLLIFFNQLSIKLYNRELDLINLRFISENTTPLDISYFVLKYVLCISWGIYIVR